MAKASLFWDTSVQAYRLRLLGDYSKTEKVVAFLKAQIPASDRSLDIKDDPITKRKDYTWTFIEKYYDGTVKFLELVYGKGNISYITKQQVEAAQQARQSAVTPRSTSPIASDCYEFMRTIPFEAAQKAYREAALRCHPDRGGNMEQMSKINALWTKLQKELYGQ